MKELSSNRKLHIIPFFWGHVTLMDLRPFEQAYFNDLPDYVDRLKEYGTKKHCYTAMHEGKVVACWGAYPLWDGVAEAWLLTAYQFETIPITSTRTAIRYFNKIYSDMQLHRLQITVNCKDELAMRWAFALKMKKEGILHNYGPDKSDYAMFARTE